MVIVPVKKWGRNGTCLSFINGFYNRIVLYPFQIFGDNLLTINFLKQGYFNARQSFYITKVHYFIEYCFNTICGNYTDFRNRKGKFIIEALPVKMYMRPFKAYSIRVGMPSAVVVKTWIALKAKWLTRPLTGLLLWKFMS